MGFYSKVQITAEEKAFRMFEEVLKAHENLLYVLTDKDDVKVIHFDWIKWYPDFDAVKAVEDVCKKLQKQEFDKDGYGYKMLILNEDNTQEEWCNDTGDTHFCDINVQCYIDNPYLA